MFKVFGFVKKNNNLSHDEYRAGHVGYHNSFGRRLKNIRGYILNVRSNRDLAKDFKNSEIIRELSLNEPKNFDNQWNGFGQLMFDNYYEPNEIVVKKGETVKFVVKNMGELVHELNIATKEMHIKHQPEMAKMVEHEILLADRIDKNKMKEMAKMDHSMAHKHANSVLLEPNNSGEIIWKFSTSAKLEIACNVPGHYEAGMIAKIIKD